jgi:hypothetical protein
MTDADPARNPPQGRANITCACLRDLPGNALIVPDGSCDEDAARAQQDVNDTQSLRFGHAPRMHVLTADSVGVVTLTL